MPRWRIGEAPAAAEIEEIAALLSAGGVVLLPTDTIYGLHALATDDAAIERLATIKGRDEGKPFVVVAANIEQLAEIGMEIRPELRTRLASLWPAPLTAVLPLSRPVAASRGAASLAVRIPDLPWLRELAALTGPLASTSANRSGEATISSPEELPNELRNRLAGVVDRGLYTGEPSTIVDFTGHQPKLIREGHAAFAQKVWKTLWNSL